MKNLKRILAVIMAIAMLLSLSISVSATGNGTATLTISIRGNYDSDYEVASGISIKQALLNAASEIENDHGLGTGPVFNGDYMVSLLTYGSEEINASEQSFVEGLLSDYVSPYTTTVTWYTPGYGAFTNHPINNYVYAGRDWVFWIEKADNTIVEPYGILMDDYIISDGDTVVINYDLYVTVFNADPTSGETIYPTYP